MPIRKSKHFGFGLFVAASAAVTFATTASCFDPDIYDRVFTSKPREEDLLLAIESCDNSMACAGISLDHNGTIQSNMIYEHSYIGPHATPKTQETTKPYTFHRGRITRGDIISVVETGIDLKGAKKYCGGHPDCVAFSYPLWSLTGINYLPNVTFVSSLEEFVPMESDEYRTYVSNDLHRIADRVNGDALPFIESVLNRPYRGCCSKTAVPTMAEIEAADNMPRISCNISREEFVLKYEIPRKAVMLVGCDEDWPARTEWTYEKLAPRFSNESQWRSRLGTINEEYSTNAWEDLANAMRGSEPFYVFDQLDDEESKSIEDDFIDPVPMRGGNLYAEMNRRGLFWDGPLRWFCMGKFGSGTKSHVDPYSSDAWNTLVRGHKWWIIYPEGVEVEETTCEQGCSEDHTFVKQWYGSIGVNAARTEYPNDKYAYHALQKPGETIYVPDILVHSVFNMDDTIAVTRNYGSVANLDKVWMEVCTSGDERRWKIMYNLVLNKEQRRRVRKTQYWPFEEGCKELAEIAIGKDGVTMPLDESRDVLHNPDWNPKVGDIVEASYYVSDRDEWVNEWYKATISKVDAHGICYVIFADGERSDGIPRNRIRKYVKPEEGEIVRAKMYNDNGEELWMLVSISQVRDDSTVNVMTHIDETLVEGIPFESIYRFDWSYAKNSLVTAMWNESGEWFKALVRNMNEDGTYEVEFVDGDFLRSVPKEDIRFRWA